MKLRKRNNRQWKTRGETEKYNTVHCKLISIYESLLITSTESIKVTVINQ